MIQWIAFHGKLLTRVRLFSWGIIADKSCVLCGGSEESHDHIFFVCPFSIAVWNLCLLKCSISRPPLPLRDEISWGLANGRSKSVYGLIFKLIFAASIYFLWGERNNRIFKAKGMPWQGVFDLIVENLHACLCDQETSAAVDDSTREALCQRIEIQLRCDLRAMAIGSHAQRPPQSQQFN
ncbi:hypothetical protein RHSIM_Rhsim01G0087700 [Rhododendron simsii]|uniref:Reverse transcriptase zinc-binding domain-containing protein n=1 Tax=Rhododendron simsii TaxID=118357 RepID=A0A834HQ08_RHOSS|nr:hypothetical protein RHSIM_Rhsim01G0087700 [Rhododendron simsii]